MAGLLADRGIDVSGRTIRRWVQKFGSIRRDPPAQKRQFNPVHA